MAVKILRARERDQDYYFAIHIDDSKVIDGEPDPAFVREFHWSKMQPPGVSKTKYLQSIREEIKNLIVLELNASNTKLNVEGQEL